MPPVWERTQDATPKLFREQSDEVCHRIRRTFPLWFPSFPLEEPLRIPRNPKEIQNEKRVVDEDDTCWNFFIEFVIYTMNRDNL